MVCYGLIADESTLKLWCDTFLVAHSKLNMHCFSNLYMSSFSCVNDPSGSLESPGTIQSHCGCDPARRSTSSSALQSWIALGRELNILNWICNTLRSVDSYARIHTYMCVCVYMWLYVYICIYYNIFVCVCVYVYIYISLSLSYLIWTYIIILSYHILT
jgi:hypothetical protein